MEAGSISLSGQGPMRWVARRPQSPCCLRRAIRQVAVGEK